MHALKNLTFLVLFTHSLKINFLTISNFCLHSFNKTFTVNQIIIALRFNMRLNKEIRIRISSLSFQNFWSGVRFFYKKNKLALNYLIDQSQILIISFISLSFPSPITYTLFYKCAHTTKQNISVFVYLYLAPTHTNIYKYECVCICIECDSVPPPLPPPVKGAYYYNNDHADLGECKL